MSNPTEFNLNYYYNVFRRYRKKIITISLSVGIVVAFLMFFVLDPIFFSTSTIKTVSKSSGIGGMLSSGIPELSDITEFTGAGGSIAKELAFYENILASRRCIEEIILKFNLMEEWDYKYMQDAVKNFRENILDLKNDKIAGTMTIGVFDKDPVRAKEINEVLIYQLNKIYIELNVQNAKNNKEFIEKRYEVVKEDLKKNEDSLKVFQDKFGIYPDMTIRAAVQAGIELETEIKSEEIKLDLLKKILSSEESEVKELEGKIKLLQEQLDLIRNSQDRVSSLNLKGTPDIALNFVRLQRNVEVQNKILSFIIPVFEQAKIEEKKETPTVLVLDYPNVPEKKVKPKRLTLTLISIIFTFIGTLLVLVLYERIKYRNTDSSL